MSLPLPTWAAAAADKWWGPKMERRTRQRALTLAGARAGTSPNPVSLLSIVTGDDTPYWKASALLFLDRWMGERYVRDAVISQTKHENPLVRASAAHTIDAAIAAGEQDHRSPRLVRGDDENALGDAAACRDIHRSGGLGEGVEWD